MRYDLLLIMAITSLTLGILVGTSKNIKEIKHMVNEVICVQLELEE